MPAQPGPSPAPHVPGYVLEELLGRGGSGQVWRARPRAGGPPVAVKVLVRGDPARQEREAALLGELDHPHLVRLHEVVRHEVRSGPAEVALVLDLLAGGSLASLLARRGRLRPGEVVTTVAPVAAALAHAHERGIVHGDLAPGNVVFTAEGRPVLTDLGTARLVGDLARAEVTPAYVDPVVARGGAPGAASDVFGLAAAAFHALTGIAPWNAADPGGTLAVAAVGELPDLALLAPEAPEELVAVVRRGLSLEPHLRGSAAAFALDLRHACRPEPVRLPVPGVLDSELGLTGRGPRTELTHQVPGLRPRAAHAGPAGTGRPAPLRAGFGARFPGWGEPGRGALLRNAARRLVVVAAVLGAVTVGVAGSVWAGSRWGSDPTAPVPAAVTGTAADGHPAGRTASAVDEPSAGDPPVDPPVDLPPPAPDPSAVPADDAAWVAVLDELYERRATAFRTADAGVLTGVYSEGPLLDRDVAAVRRLAAAGQALAGFAPQVRRVVSVSPQSVSEAEEATVELRVVDELPGYRVVAAEDPPGSAGQQLPGRGAAEVRLVLTPTAGGWRISDAEVSP